MRVTGDLAAGGSVPGQIGIDDVTLQAPLPTPIRNVFCLGPNYADHARESGGLAQPESPTYFSKATTTVAPPDSTLELDPALTTQVDWEVELGVVMARGGRRISAATAHNYVLGYTVAVDLSARDLQHGRPEGQWFLGKSLDGFCPLGPAIVTTDELPDPQSLELELRVNGVVKQRASTSTMLFPVSAIIADLSRYVTLLPGDIICTGTPAGVGNARTPPEHLQAGDRLVASIAGIGTIRVDFAL